MKVRLQVDLTALGSYNFVQISKQDRNAGQPAPFRLEGGKNTKGEGG